MSSTRRPWYQWHPKDFISDEKVQALSPMAELLYRRALDVMWQANDCQLPNVCQKLANAIGKGFDIKTFEDAWNEIQFDGFELFKTSRDGKWIYSQRLLEQKERIENISKTRASLGKKGGKAKAKQLLSKSLAKAKQKGSNTDIDIDVKGDTKVSPPPTQAKPATPAPTASHFKFKVGDQFDNIKTACQEIDVLSSRNGKKMNAWAWVTSKTKTAGHPVAITDSLQYLIKTWDETENPWGMAEAVFKTKNPKMNEQMERDESLAFKGGKEQLAKEFKSLWSKLMAGKTHGDRAGPS